VSAAVGTAVAASMDELGARVDRDIDAVERRLQELAVLLEGVVAAVQDVLSRRRGASTEALEMLRQVAAEQARASGRAVRDG